MKNWFGSMPSIKETSKSTDGHSEVYPYKESIENRLGQVLDSKKGRVWSTF